MGANDAAPPLIIRLFGPFAVRVNGDPLPRLRFRKSESVLALLALRHGGEVDRSWLAGLLWPESSDSQALRNCLTDLRRALGAQACRLHSPTPHTLCLDLTGAAVDILAFDAAIDRGDPGSLEEAVVLRRGPLLEGCAEEWAFPERQRREEAYLTALERLAALALARGEPAVAERHLRQAVGADPLRESAQRALMQALAAGGNYAAALLVYRELRLRLHREVNAEPDPETRALFEQLRAEARQSQDRPRGVLQSPKASLASVARRPLIAGGTVTFLFTDIEGSTRLWEEQPEPMREALARHTALLREAIEADAGYVFKTVGDGVCAAFATAPETVAAALAAQRALQKEAWEGFGPLRVRMALHTGAAEEREGDYFGPPLNRVARLLDAGHGGQILLSLATQELARDSLPQGASLRDLGEYRLKDLVRPERIFQLVSPDLPADYPPLKTLDIRPNNLPVQPTPLIGREKETAAVGELLRREAVRLVTLTGPGGTGKTRLGLQVAADMLDACGDGVFLVALAPIREPGLVASTIAQALGVREVGDRPLVESLKEYLRHRQLLLVLDNFEQVLRAAPLVAELLAGCPRLKVLVTSRASLRLQGEHERPVPPLALPDPKHMPPVEALSQYAAVALFIQRAAAVKPEFAVTNENAPAVAEICFRLDGLPLAIELAAARIKLLPPGALLARLERRLPLLVGGARDLPARQQTMRGTIAWSYDLLSKSEQALFRRLSVFVGGCGLEAAEAVCGGADNPIDVLAAVASLVDQSLLRQLEASPAASGYRAREAQSVEPRFGMLETIREYGQECLAMSGEAEDIRRRHAQFFLALAEAAELKLRTAAKREWLERLEGEHDNFRAALAWCQSDAGDEEMGLRLAASLWWFWYLRDYRSEGLEWLERTLARSDADQRTTARAKVLEGAGLVTGDRRLGKESVAIFRELGDALGLAGSLRTLAMILTDQGDFSETRSLGEEALAICQEQGDRWGLIPSLYVLGDLAFCQSDYATAQRLWEESLRVCREVEDQWNLSWSLLGLGNVAERRGDWRVARTYYEKSLRVFRELGNQFGIVFGLIHLAGAAAGQDEPQQAARLLGATEALLGAAGAVLQSHHRADCDRYTAAARAALGEEAFAAAWAAGREMTLEQAIAYGLQESSDA